MSYYLLLTIDVEDWFQVENFKQYIPFASWSSYELRVEKNTHRLLDLLDSTSLQRPAPKDHKSESSDKQTFTPLSGEAYLTGASNSNNADLRNSTRLNKPNDLSQSPRQRRIGLSQFHPRPPRLRKSNGGQEETEKTKKSRQSCQSCQTKTKSPKATFFILGWIAERLPNLVREIHSRGHEVASHGYYHNVCNEQSHEDLKADLCDCKKLLEDIIGTPVFGYRAPSFSINNDILKVIEECGYLYDSSYNSFSMHGRYGHLDLSRNGTTGIAFQIPRTQNSKSKIQNPWPRPGIQAQQPVPIPGPDHRLDRTKAGTSRQGGPKSKIFYELPISNLKFAHQLFPWGGGGYFRLIPFTLFKIGIKFILGQENAYLFYFHPWEIDPDQPKVNDAPVFYKFRHYINLSKTHIKLSKLIENFTHCNFITCSQYLDEVGKCAL